MKQFVADLHSGKLHQDFHNPQPGDQGGHGHNHGGQPKQPQQPEIQVGQPVQAGQPEQKVNIYMKFFLSCHDTQKLVRTLETENSQNTKKYRLTEPRESRLEFLEFSL